MLVTAELVRSIVAEEAGKIRAGIGDDRYQHGMFDQAGRVSRWWRWMTTTPNS